MNDAYKKSGVDVEAGYKSVELIKSHVQGTFRKEVLSDIGGFGGMFSLSALKDMKEPVAVSATDGVGTKLKVAFLMDKHNTIGIDCVAMCVNDIICSGAEPLFFLDYIACGKNYPEKIEQIVKGVAEGCKMAGVSLIGGETAEMPGFYPEDEYDLAGFSVGAVDRNEIIDGKNIRAGDMLIGIASSGLHSNGYSLVRKLLRLSKSSVTEYVEDFSSTLGEELLKPTKIYVKTIQQLMNRLEIKGISNITGGGFIENIPRMLPGGLKAKINKGSWKALPVFNFIKAIGNISEADMYNTFNMGIGMVLTVYKKDVDEAIKIISDMAETAYLIGEVTQGEGIEIC